MILCDLFDHWIHLSLVESGCVPNALHQHFEQFMITKQFNYL